MSLSKARILYYNGRHNSALEQLKKVKDRTAQVLEISGLIKLEIGDLSGALRDFEEAIRIEPTEDLLLYRRKTKERGGLRT